MFYASSSLENYLPDIKPDSREGHFQYAIVDTDKLITTRIVHLNS